MEAKTALHKAGLLQCPSIGLLQCRVLLLCVPVFKVYSPTVVTVWFTIRVILCVCAWRWCIV